MSNKRKVAFAEEEDDPLERAYAEVASGEGGSEDKQTRFHFKEKHSLDSDEEDNTDKYDVMNEDDIEGQEDGHVDIVDGMKFTPFNMNEELEEGHFDTHGTYIFKKEAQIQDNWIDNIDWVKVKEVENKGADNQDDTDSEGDHAPVDETEMFKEMVSYMKPGETVLKALKRLGGGKSGSASGSASQRWKAKKAKASHNGNSAETLTAEQAEEAAKNKETFLKLTECADKLLQNGNFEIYQDTQERLSFRIKVAEDKKAKERLAIPDSMDDDDALDMFADDFDAKDKKSKDVEPSPSGSADNTKSTDQSASMDVQSSSTDVQSSSTDVQSASSGVQWQYKWENEDDAEVHGPFSSEQMSDWKDDDFFKAGVYVRKVGAEGEFYTSNRIDFDLYV